MNEALLKILSGHLTQAAWLYRKDLAAMGDRVTQSPAPGARSAADIVWEVVQNNYRGAKRIRGEDPGPTVGFPTCPAEFANPESLAKEIKASADTLLDAVGEDPMRTVTYPGGSESALEYVEFMVHHMMYHLGQLNYIQVLFGDAEIHWS
jgi:hypothetical protein